MRQAAWHTQAGWGLVMMGFRWSATYTSHGSVTLHEQASATLFTRLWTCKDCAIIFLASLVLINLLISVQIVLSTHVLSWPLQHDLHPPPPRPACGLLPAPGKVIEMLCHTY